MWNANSFSPCSVWSCSNRQVSFHFSTFSLSKFPDNSSPTQCVGGQNLQNRVNFRCSVEEHFFQNSKISKFLGINFESYHFPKLFPTASFSLSTNRDAGLRCDINRSKTSVLSVQGWNWTVPSESRRSWKLTVELIVPSIFNGTVFDMRSKRIVQMKVDGPSLINWTVHF